MYKPLGYFQRKEKKFHPWKNDEQFIKWYGTEQIKNLNVH